MIEKIYNHAFTKFAPQWQCEKYKELNSREDSCLLLPLFIITIQLFPLFVETSQKLTYTVQ